MAQIIGTPKTHVSLQWEHYENHFISELKKLPNDNTLTDVILACDGQCMKAHKLILSLCSPFFKKMFLVKKAQSISISNTMYN